MSCGESGKSHFTLRLNKEALRDFFFFNYKFSPIIPTLSKLKQKNYCKFEDSLGCIVSSKHTWTTKQDTSFKIN